jgi:hypothetical protein
MPLLSTTTIRPNQALNTGSDQALIIEEFTGLVEGTIARKSALQGFVTVKPVKGTSTLTNYGVGESTLGKVTPGTMPDGNQTEFNRLFLTVDTLVYARATLPLLDSFQTQFDTRNEIATEHGKKIAKFWDQSFFIQAFKAAALANSAYSTLDGHSGGSTVTLTAAGDKLDPAKVYKAIADLFILMEGKDVDPQNDDVILAMRPDIFYTLQQAEQIINSDYITSNGTKIEGMTMFKTFGVPVISSNNVPNSVIAAHLLSNTANGSAYDGDFSKLAILAFSPRALLAGETIPLTSDVFYDKLTKQWFIDSHISYGVTPNRAEYAGRIMLP